MRLSIVIPTLNEVCHLTTAVTAVRRRAVLAAPHQVIVVDCGSVDGTPELAWRLQTHLIQGPPHPWCRAAALNRGAARASGDVLLFVDADSLVPPAYDRAIRQALQDPGVVGGAFEFALDGPEWGLRVVELVNRVRYRIWPYYYGDQGVFVRRAAFQRLRSYAERRLFEASEFCQRMGRLGRLVLVRRCMKTSPRRFVGGGIYRVLAQDFRLWLLDLLGRPTEHYGPAYQEDNYRRGLQTESGLAGAGVPPTPTPL
jgi:glycosyltransferase involved in cell wall biosynthesis